MNLLEATAWWHVCNEKGMHCINDDCPMFRFLVPYDGDSGPRREGKRKLCNILSDLDEQLGKK